MINLTPLTKNLLQSSRTISKSEGTGQKVRDSAIFEIARLHQEEIRDSEILRIHWRVAGQVRKKQGYHEKISKRPKHVWVNEPINIKNIRL